MYKIHIPWNDSIKPITFICQTDKVGYSRNRINCMSGEHSSPQRVYIIGIYYILILYWSRVKIFIDHECYFEHDCVVKLSQIKACELLDFFKTVNKGVSVNKELS